jgi:glycosyltransferase involved in cell wall biosynthesis
MAQHVGRGMHIGYPIFELDKFTEIEMSEVESMDYVFVCSEWARDVVGNNCPGIYSNRIVVVPCGVDRHIFNENIGAPDPKWTTFLNIGKWEYRKGHDILVEAFSKAFEPRDKVRLWMMNHNPFLSERQTGEWEGMYKSSSMGDHISFLPRVRTHYEVAKVMSEADCGVFPSRAEGWNLELIEMMSMGKQVITTDYSAHTEFCHSGNAHLVEIDELEPAYDGVFFGDDTVGSWAKLGDDQQDCLVEHMRAVHANKTAGNSEGIETAREFSWDAAAKRIVEIDGIWG